MLVRNLSQWKLRDTALGGLYEEASDGKSQK